MKTIQEAVTKIINKTPFVEEALYDKLINVSSLARLIHPEVEKLLRKDVKEGAIMMAINRLSPSSLLKIRKNVRNMAFSSGDFLVRSDLSDYTFKNSSTLLKQTAKVLEETTEDNDSFLTISQGVFETNIVVSKPVKPLINAYFKAETLIHSVENLASLTIRLPKDNIEQSGIYYFILKQLAWADISVLEIISTTNEMTVIVEETKINETFAILMDLKLS